MTKQKKKSMAIGLAAENYLLLIQIIPQVTIWLVILIIEVIMCYKQGNTILSTLIDCAGGEELLEKKKEIVRDDGSSVFVEKGSSSKGKEPISERKEDSTPRESEKSIAGETSEKRGEIRKTRDKDLDAVYKVLEEVNALSQKDMVPERAPEVSNNSGGKLEEERSTGNEEVRSSERKRENVSEDVLSKKKTLREKVVESTKENRSVQQKGCEVIEEKIKESWFSQMKGIWESVNSWSVKQLVVGTLGVIVGIFIMSQILDMAKIALKGWVNNAPAREMVALAKDKQVAENARNVAEITAKGAAMLVNGSMKATGSSPMVGESMTALKNNVGVGLFAPGNAYLQGQYLEFLQWGVNKVKENKVVVGIVGMFSLCRPIVFLTKPVWVLIKMWIGKGRF